MHGVCGKHPSHLTGVQHCCEQVGVSLCRRAGCWGRPASGRGVSTWLLSRQGSASGSFCPSSWRARCWHPALCVLPIRSPSRPPSSRLFHCLFFASSHQGGSARKAGCLQFALRNLLEACRRCFQGTEERLLLEEGGRRLLLGFPFRRRPHGPAFRSVLLAPHPQGQEP